LRPLDLLYLPAALLTAPWWARKDRADWPARFGKGPPVPNRYADAAAGAVTEPLPRLLIHAVSVGEVNALRELVPLLAGRAHLVISVGTDTGIARARALFSASPHTDVVRYPLDLSWSVRRFLRAVRPDAVALVELELWPQFIGACRRRGIPVAVINGRLSERSFRGYRRLRPLLRSTFASLEFAAVQDEAYAARFEHMGVPPQRCLVSGSMKWDAAKLLDTVPGADLLAAEMGVRRGEGAPPLVVAGSTMEDEEALLHEACGPDIQLLCAPRKPEHFEDAARALPGCVRRTQRRPAMYGQMRFLLDTIGELSKAYALADLVVLGRSFGSLYGSDPVEPIALGKPVIIGPAISDFARIVAEFEREGGIVRATRDDLGPTVHALLASEARRAVIAELGRDVIRRHQGASRRHAELLLSLLDSRRVRAAEGQLAIAGR
jgi:3-deoxy-D-manno-octulosonic-acid transferase